MPPRDDLASALLAGDARSSSRTGLAANSVLTCAPLQSISASAQYRIALKVGIMIKREYDSSRINSGGELENKNTAIQPIKSAAIHAGTNNAGQRGFARS